MDYENGTVYGNIPNERSGDPTPDEIIIVKGRQPLLLEVCHVRCKANWAIVKARRFQTHPD